MTPHRTNSCTWQSPEIDAEKRTEFRRHYLSPWIKPHLKLEFYPWNFPLYKVI